MAKVLFMSLPGHGHVNPTLGLVSELIKRGEEITYYVTKDFQKKIEATGAKFVEYQGEVDLFSIANLLNNSQYIDAVGMMNTIKGFEKIIDALLEEKGKFDYFIYDLFLPLGEVIGKKLNIPTICSITTFALNKKMRDEMTGGSISRFKDLLSINGGFSRFKEILMLRVGFKRFIEIINENKELFNYIKKLEDKYQFGLSDIESIGIQKAMLNIVYTSRYLQPYADKFDESYKFIGPSIVSREENNDFDLKNIKNKRIVYISLGTIFNDSTEFYTKCMKAFKDFDLQFIMAVGTKVNINDFKNIPKNFIVKNFLPQLEILKHTEIFITHGGMNSVNEGLYFGTPLVLIPQSVDQPMVARRVAELGAGIIIDKNEITEQSLKNVLNEILLDRSYGENSKVISESLKNAGGYIKAADEIFQLKEQMHINN